MFSACQFVTRGVGVFATVLFDSARPIRPKYIVLYPGNETYEWARLGEAGGGGEVELLDEITRGARVIETWAYGDGAAILLWVNSGRVAIDLALFSAAPPPRPDYIADIYVLKWARMNDPDPKTLLAHLAQSAELAPHLPSVVAMGILGGINSHFFGDGNGERGLAEGLAEVVESGRLRPHYQTHAEMVLANAQVSDSALVTLYLCPPPEPVGRAQIAIDFLSRLRRVSGLIWTGTKIKWSGGLPIFYDWHFCLFSASRAEWEGRVAHLSGGTVTKSDHPVETVLDWQARIFRKSFRD